MERLFLEFCCGALGAFIGSVIIGVFELFFHSDDDGKKCDFWVRTLCIMFFFGALFVVI